MSKQDDVVIEWCGDTYCPPLSDQALDPERAARFAVAFKALGDPVRLRLLSLIASGAAVGVCHLSASFALSGPTISHHLRILREAGLVECERHGTWAYYRTRPESLRRLAGLLADSPVPA